MTSSSVEEANRLKLIKFDPEVLRPDTRKVLHETYVEMVGVRSDKKSHLLITSSFLKAVETLASLCRPNKTKTFTVYELLEKLELAYMKKVCIQAKNV